MTRNPELLVKQSGPQHRHKKGVEMSCSHKYDVVIDGYQYCKKCGIALSAPCTHCWVTIETKTIQKNINKKESIPRKLYTLKCSICGDYKEVDAHA